MNNEVMNFNPPSEDPVNPSVSDEVNMWVPLLEVLSKGLPVPFNPAKMVSKIIQESKKDFKNKEHYDKILSCCYSIDQINEVKYYKPLIEAILNRIIFLTNLQVDYIQLKNE